MTTPPTGRLLSIQGTHLLMDGQPFYFQGLSFFNAPYNPTFNRSREEGVRWLQKFRANGINALRIWAQWDFEPPRVFADVAPGHSLYTDQGDLQERHMDSLMQIIEDVAAHDMLVELVLFSAEKDPNLPVQAQVRAAHALTTRLLPYRDLIVQIWNENATDMALLFESIKAVDPARIVTSSPGWPGVLGDDAHNDMLDILTPHTERWDAPHYWEVAQQQIAALLERFGKPVIDDEPARCGTTQFGGIKGGTTPEQHIEQIRGVRALGGYHTYHHDMFQLGYGDPSVPPSGIPDPDFNPFHRQVMNYLRDNPRW
ncbi:MAG: hypothetical protein ACYC5M_16205 [Anaerolineae bacterium]